LSKVKKGPKRPPNGVGIRVQVAYVVVFVRGEREEMTVGTRRLVVKEFRADLE